MIIDRRNLLTSRAATTVCTPLTANAADITARGSAIQERGHLCEGWCLAMESRPQRTNHVIDFWARPVSDIEYTQYLPPEITRYAMWYALMKVHCRDWVGVPTFAAQVDGIETLSSALRSLIEPEAPNSRARTAFISLDSLSLTPVKEPGWAEVLPAFRSCYDHIIGHFHLPQRGLRQWRSFLNDRFGEGYFQEYFVNAAAQCDAVIVTSTALVESDLWCSPRASTEELGGKLMRDLGCALLTPAVLERIVGAGERGTVRKPRLFALASLELYTPEGLCELGGHTFFGKLADEIAGRRVPTAFDQGINRFTWLMIKFIMVMVPLVFLINGLTKHDWRSRSLLARLAPCRRRPQPGIRPR